MSLDTLILKAQKFPNTPVSQQDLLAVYEVIKAANASAEWGAITGTLSSQSDLQAELDKKTSFFTALKISSFRA